MNVTSIHVGPPEGAGAYEVSVGTGISTDIASSIPSGANQVLLAHTTAVPETVAAVERSLQDAGLQVHRFAMPDAEAAKTVEVLAQGWSLLGQWAFTRTDPVVAVGGGAVTDAAGFIAASWLRGVPLIQVPTTLLAMVDAAVGGKTGINIPEGKNLVGAFHPPAAVVCDLETLRTLPDQDLRAGLAEVIKAGFIVDEQILRIVEDDLANGATMIDCPTSEPLRELVERAIRVKADVVTQDLKESSLREILNYGHTFAHAIEQAEHYTWRHGDAVSVGMIFIAELAHRAGLIDRRLVQRHRDILDGVGLPTQYRGPSWEDLRTVMMRDKKTRSARLRFVALDGAVGRVTRLEAPQETWLRRAYDAVSAEE